MDFALYSSSVCGYEGNSCLAVVAKRGIRYAIAPLTSEGLMHFQEVIDFWFSELPPSAWFKGGQGLDGDISARFGEVHWAAIAGELYSWRHEPLGRLAEIIVLDQFSRNIHRDTPSAFSADGQALILAQEAIRNRADTVLSQQQRVFMYMPYMHSESLAIQSASIRLFEAVAIANNTRFARHHYNIIVEFGRYPHRNNILGRESTEAELAFLAKPGSSF
jgi:uncharacterized protein (DUF924 family)